MGLKRSQRKAEPFFQNFSGFTVTSMDTTEGSHTKSSEKDTAEGLPDVERHPQKKFCGFVSFKDLREITLVCPL